jgi:hypothetical protein
MKEVWKYVLPALRDVCLGKQNSNFLIVQIRMQSKVGNLISPRGPIKTLSKLPQKDKNKSNALLHPFSKLSTKISLLIQWEKYD